MARGRRYKTASSRQLIYAKEKKYDDLNITFVPIPAAGVTSSVLPIVDQGSGETQRVGRKIYVQSIRVKGFLELIAATLSDHDLVYVSLILDRQNNNATANPTFGEVFTEAAPEALLNLDNSGRFKILKSWYLGMNADATDVNKYVPIDWYHEFGGQGLMFQYTGTGGGRDDLVDNNLFLKAVTKQGAVNLDVNIRIRFTD